MGAVSCRFEDLPATSSNGNSCPPGGVARVLTRVLARVLARVLVQQVIQQVTCCNCACHVRRSLHSGFYGKWAVSKHLGDANCGT